MKQLKTICFGMIFLFGLTAMTINNDEEQEEIPCTTIHNICDFVNPEFEGFDECMQRNGCG